MDHHDPTTGAEPGERARAAAAQAGNAARERARDEIGAVARALRAASDTLRDEQHGAMSDLGRQAAARIERFADSVERKDYNEMLADLRGFGRERPALFLGALFVTGLLAGRFLRAQSPDHEPGEAPATAMPPHGGAP